MSDSRPPTGPTPSWRVQHAGVARRERGVRAHEREHRGDQQHQAGGGGQAREHARRALEPRADGAVERLEHRREIPRAVVAQAVDEQRRRAGHAIAATVVEIGLDPEPYVVAGEVAREALFIEAELARQLVELGISDRR